MLKVILFLIDIDKTDICVYVTTVNFFTLTEHKLHIVLVVFEYHWHSIRMHKENYVYFYLLLIISEKSGCKEIPN